MISASGVPLRWIPPTGSEGFTMGTDPDSPGRYVDEGPVQAHLTEGLWVMEHEVTHAMFASMMNTVSHFDGGHRPVDSVTWCEAVLFANRLSAAEGLVPAYLGVEHWPVERCDEVAANGVELRADANGYRLLTEAEWEWSARAGAPTTYAGGDELEAVAWWMGNSDGGPAEVCTRDANAWGLCDMTGNVSEWVQDAYFATLTGGDDPLVMAGGDRVFRGGSWFVAENDLRVANRAWSQPGERWYDVGFRLGRSE